MTFRNKSVSVHDFAMVPRADIPRSSFRMQRGYKTAFDSGYLIPIFCEEVLPGDTWSLNMTAFCRLATPIFPFMDNLYMDSFFFYVPARLLWVNWEKFMGSQDNPGDSISFTIPQCTSPAGGFLLQSVPDYLGLPTVGQVAGGNVISCNALPLRAYNQIYNEWFRDQNIIGSQSTASGDGPDASTQYPLQLRGKRHDYFTGCLPYAQKSSTAVSIGLVGNATVKTNPTALVTGVQSPALWLQSTTGTGFSANSVVFQGGASSVLRTSVTATGAGTETGAYPTNLYADLSTATATTINQLRQSFQIQKLLERDARGGTRYVEVLQAHFGVRSPDARLQRPEYLGGGTTMINVNAVAQTSNTPVSGTPQGNLAAFAQGTARHGFTQSFVEHGYVMGIVNVRADLSYQQGMRKMWNRLTRYDFYFPVFAALGEQAVQLKEIFCDGSANDTLTFGFQERWAEYRYLPSQITGLMRSTSVGTIDPWHLAQRFSGAPGLSASFIKESPPVSRVIAAGTNANGQQLLLDAFFDIRAARPMPMYSVPGLIDHF